MTVEVIEFDEAGVSRATAGPLPSGARGVVGWPTLVEALRNSGHVRVDETVTHFAPTERGIEFVVVKARRRRKR